MTVLAQVWFIKPVFKKDTNPHYKARFFTHILFLNIMVKPKSYKQWNSFETYHHQQHFSKNNSI